MTNSRLTSFSKEGMKRILGSSVPIIVFLLSIFCVQQNTWAQTCAPVCKHLNISLDQNCEATVLIGSVLDSSGCVNGDFTIQLEYTDGTPVPTSPVLHRTELGTIVAVITDTISGNSCWSFLTVEDKLGPSIDCSNDTFSCFELPNYPPPIVSDNCFNPNEISLEIIGMTPPVNYGCNSEDFISYQVITWQATDGSGMTAQCDQTVYIERIDTSLIAFPDHHLEINNTALSCDINYDLDSNGVLDWELTGYPTYDGYPLYPGVYPDCNLTVLFQDTDFGTVDCKHKIMRLWTVREWYCTYELELSVPQLIEIVDTTNPVIVCPGDLTVTTTPGDCDAQVYLPDADATDNCSAIEGYDVNIYDNTGALYAYLPSNGGLVSLPVGHYRALYTVFDECWNTDTCSIWVDVVDDTPPIAICDQHTVVSLTNNGKARAPAHVFDDGSWDECGIDRFEVARMFPACGYNTAFHDFIEFSCCDIGPDPVMVVFRVWDKANNYNDCMVEAIIQDKIAPIIVCPPDITISCTFPYNLGDLDASFGKVVALDSFNQLNHPLLDPRDDIIIDDPDNPPYNGPVNWGKDGYAVGSCGVTIADTFTTYLNQCGTGYIRRIFTVTNSSGMQRSCYQYIYVEDFTPFNYQTIDWPDDITVTGGCGGDVDPSNTGVPTFDYADCELVGISDPVDWVFNFNDPDNPACFKILRTWKVIDWCNYNDLTGEGIWDDTQIIKVINTGGPDITGCDDVSVCSQDPDCVSTHVDVSISASDDCTDFSLLRFSYAIDFDNNGSFDVTNQGNPYADFDNEQNEASGTYPIGTHRILWAVRDGCGNESTCESMIRVINCKPPSPYCYNGLAAELMPMDRNGDGTFDWAELELWASDFDAGSYHTCYDAEDLVLSFSSDTSHKSILFTCDSLGKRYVELWVTSPNGIQARCIAFVDIQDNNQVCPPGSGSDSLSGNISGKVVTEMGEEMYETLIQLTGSDEFEMTNLAGQYAFLNMPYGGSYQLDPDRDDHYLNGVTAHDLSLIQRHIASVDELNSAYKHFAADANNDDEVDIRDVLDLRKLLLGIYDELPNHDSWMFLDATCSFGPGNPLTQPCGEVYDIPVFDQDMTVDFIGIKIGDVDEDAEVNLDEGDTRRSRHIDLVTMDIFLQEGNRYEIPVRVSGDASLHAIQLTYSLDPGSAVIQNIRAEGMVDAAFNTNYASRGLISQVWATTEEMDFNDATTVIIEILATRDGLLSDMFEVNSQITDAIGFDAQGAMDVRLSFDQEIAVVEGEAFELFQNRPNPFDNQTIIGFKLPEQSFVALTITDISGREIYRIADDFEAGAHEIKIDKSQLNTSGIMYYRLDTGKYTATKKMILLD